MKKTINTLVFLSVLFIGYSQEYQADIGKVISAIEASQHYQIESKILMYDNVRSKNLIQSFDAIIKSTPKGYRSKIGETEVISNKDIVVMIDHEEGLIQIENQQNTSNKDEKLLNEIRRLNGNDSTIISTELVHSTVDTRTYTIRMKGEIIQANITLNVKSNSIEQIEYFYDEERFPNGNYVVIKYQQFNVVDPIETTVINGYDIFTKKGKTFIVTEKYKTYQLMNFYID